MAYITLANANSIVFNSDLKDSYLQGKIYKIPIYFLSRYEEQSLLAIQELLQNPEHYFTEIYQPYEPADTFKYVYEGMCPAYHNDPTCERLNSDWENYEIPSDIRDRGRDAVLEFREWFETVAHLIEDKPDAFVVRLQARWGILTNVNAISRGNSGHLEIENLTIQKLENRVESRIRAAGRFYYSSDKTKVVLKQFSKYAFLGYQDDPIRNNRTGFPDHAVKELLRYYTEQFKKPLKRDLVEYYRIKLNPKIKMEGYFLENLGFKPCGTCCRNDISRTRSGMSQSLTLS
ncbi:MAG: hypothetical protein HOG80_15880 [Candidatus Marinimicrobia bacterium]|nr:hypothetical protein [Candidatus Neomarinimicrobiota bacterium]